MAARRLVLIRHAKAAEGAVDLVRPLAPRGVRDAGAVGEWLADNDLVPDRVVISPARRVRETWARAAERLRHAPDAVVDDRIYENDVGALLDVIRDTPDTVRTLALLGHNPSFGDLAYQLDDGTGDAEARQDVTAGFPTSAVAVYEVDDGWSGVTPRGARLVKYAAPRG